MDNNPFAIRSRTEAELLQRRINAIREERNSHDLLQSGFLTRLFDYTHSGTDGDPRILTAFLDVEFTFIFMEADIAATATIHNRDFANERPLANVDPLTDDVAFNGKLDMLGHLTASALRCRAFWDKYFGILFLLADPANYEAFTKAKSRRKFFAKHAASWDPAPNHVLQFLEHGDVQSVHTDPSLRNTDVTIALRRSAGLPKAMFPDHLLRVVDALDRIRTAEAHGTGTLRRSVLSSSSFNDARGSWLFKHHNIAMRGARALRRELADLTRPLARLSTVLTRCRGPTSQPLAVVQLLGRGNRNANSQPKRSRSLNNFIHFCLLPKFMG